MKDGGQVPLNKVQCSEFARNKSIAAICAAPSILATLGLIDGKKVTVHPDFEDKIKSATVLDKSVVVDGNIITGQGLGVTMDFTFELVRCLVGEECLVKLKKAICYKG